MVRPWKICIICGEFKEHYVHDKGMCRNCYQRKRSRTRYKKSTNKKSTNYLGCTIAEKVLSKVFKDVKVMSYGNPGYDFICSKGKLMLRVHV